ncbi:MAG: hypothetical protein UR23_C0035G0008 [Candidatus Roizmanbacteria bacterium GW2011_GWA2_32_13]|uniref:Uncharacterized protein n=1 Tax=Candidatus Roizmanbacteria bacterium GW2011_GWA2_32_13 TaxID=1618475 RepID=A0A0F9Z7I0_9BACT|nr:MAG: hypothetical protein UR23_C0035G0008 [Candidatus Roizmanbacteria bacterium GW2011_GWA2_32_13]
MAQDVSYAPVDLGFKIPEFNEVLTFIVRFFFIIAGLIALIYLLQSIFFPGNTGLGITKPIVFPGLIN